MKRDHRFGRPSAALAILALAFVPPADAQTVRGRVVEEGTRQPLAGAFVVLVDAEGNRHDAVLSDGDGRFTIQAVEPGTYRIKAELIGYATIESRWLDLGAGGTVAQELEVPVQAISLDAISVQSRNRCRPRPGVGPGTAHLWAEAKKALDVTQWAEEQEALRMRIMEYSRELSPNAHSVREASQRSRTGYYDQSPYRSRPADELAREGYIRMVGDNEYEYYAPDAEVLLSGTFLEHHCFWVVEGEAEEDDGLVGLAFEPVRGRDVPEIEGTLWMDQGTAELRRLDFRYTRLPFRGVTSSAAGGRVEFERLANGVWIVQRWRLRMPLVAQKRGASWRGSRTRLEVVALNEIGAEVQRVTDLRNNVLAQAEAATLYGTVWDSVAGEPLADAVVTLEGTDRRATSAANGTYRFNDLESGTYEVVFNHPSVEMLGVEPAPRRVALESGRAVRLPLAIPDGRRIAEAVCGKEEGARSFVVGQVLDESLTWPVQDAVVRIDPATGDPRTTTADGSGVFRVCVRSQAGPALVTAFRPGDAVAALNAEAAERVARAGQVVDSPEPATLRLHLTVRAPEARVTATWTNVIHGRVLEEGSRTPIADVSITMRDTLGQPITTAVSDENGAFRLPHPGSGARFDIQAEHIAYERASGTVDFGAREELAVELILAERPIELEPIVVVERRQGYLAETGFYMRNDRGLGRFMTRTDIEKHRPTFITDVIRRVAGVTVTGRGVVGEIRMQGTKRLMGWRDIPATGGTGTGGLECRPTIYLDGAMARPGGDSDRSYTPTNDLVRPEDVEAIEVYRRSSEVPARFSGAFAGCGVIAIWTRR